MSPVRALVVMLVACALGCRAELDLKCEAFTDAMKDVAGVLECYSSTAQESLQINKVNSDSLQSLSDTVALLKKQISLENQKTVESIKLEIHDLIKEGTYQQEIQELQAQFEIKDKEVEQLTQANAELKTKLTENEKLVEQLATKLADNGKLISTVTNENHDLRSQLAAKDKKVEQLMVANEEQATELADNRKQVQNLEQRLSVSVQQVDILTEKGKTHNSTVQDLTKRLQESELQVQQLHSTVMKLNQTCKEEADQDPECRLPQLQEIQDVVQRYRSSKDLTQLREDLRSTLDSSSVEFQQVQSLGRVEYFTFRLGESGYTQLVTLLLCAGLPVDAADGNGNTMLHGAAVNGQVQLVRLLLQHGAQVDARGGEQYTPLIRAAYSGQLEVVKVLVEAGASTIARDQSGYTALEAAWSNDHTAVVQYLQQQH